MKKSLSAILAASMAFSMFASAAFAADAAPTLDSEGKFQALKTAGIFQGYPDGKSHLEANMTRAEFAKALAALLQLEGNASAAAVFTDVPANHWAIGEIGALAEKKIIEGIGAGKFGPKLNVTVEQVAKIVVTSLGLPVAADATVEGKVSDWAKGYVAAAVGAGLLPKADDYTKLATRADLVDASFSVYEKTAVLVKETKIVDSKNIEVTFNDGGVVKKELETALVNGVATKVEVEYKGAKYTVEVTLQQAAVEAKASGAKKVEVKFSKAVDDTKAVFTVKKGSITLNVAAKSFSADKTTATLELSSKLTAGEYTVAVTGVEDKEISSKFTAVDEKVSKIEFLSTNAPLVDSTNADDALVDDLSIPYKVTNQYGEDITKTTTLEKNIGTLNASKGLVEITGDYKVGDKVAVTLIHAATTTSVVQTFEVAAQARVAEVTVTGLYNKDNKTLADDTDLAANPFYLLVEAKDQYGNAITDAAKLTADLVAPVETNTTVVDAAAAYESVDVSGTSKTALRLNAPAAGLKAGQSQITLISNTSGKSGTFTVTVAESSRADKANLTNPGLIVADEDNYFPVEVFDKQGNAVTSLSSLNGDKGVKITLDGTEIANPFTTKDGVLQVKIPKANIGTAATAKTIIALPKTPGSTNLTTLTIDIKAKAVPTIVRGVDSDYAKTYLNGKVGVALGYTNLAIEDQYGRVMSDDNVKTWLDADTDRKIGVTEDGTSTIVALTDADITSASGAAFTTGAANGTEKITLTLHGDDGAAINSSSADVTLRVTNGSEYKSYSVDTIGTVYDELGATKADAAAYDKEVKVYGVLADGSKVQLTNSADYTVTSLSNTAIAADVSADSKLNVTAALSYATDKSEVVIPVQVTIGATGEVIPQDVTFSKAAPKVTAVKFVDNNNVDAGTVTEKTVSTATFNVASLVSNAASSTNAVVTDQYGAKVLVANNGTVTFADGTTVTAVTFTVKPASGTTITITDNGKATAAVAGLDAYESFDVLVTYPNGVTATITVKR